MRRYRLPPRRRRRCRRACSRCAATGDSYTSNSNNTELLMARSGKAAICRELNKPVVVETISVESPKRGEVMVKLAACGVCHSDLSATNGTIPLPPPLILGHEAAGEVVEVGEGVDGIAPGDHVVSSFIYMCGRCR